VLGAAKIINKTAGKTRLIDNIELRLSAWLAYNSVFQFLSTAFHSKVHFHAKNYA
jgi:hypothetical protein